MGSGFPTTSTDLIRGEAAERSRGAGSSGQGRRRGPKRWIAQGCGLAGAQRSATSSFGMLMALYALPLLYLSWLA